MPSIPSLPFAPSRAMFAFGALCALLVAIPAEAQDRTWPPQYRRDRPQLALEAAGVLSSLQGNAVAGATDGSGFDVLASVGVSVLSLGGGYQRSTHRFGDGDAVVHGVFFEPRVALPFAARNFTPFAYGRVSRLDRSLTLGATESRASGTGFGGGVGTYVWLAPHVQLNTTVGWTSMRFGAADGETFPVPGPTNGSSWGVRAGLTLGFDRWGR